VLGFGVLKMPKLFEESLKNQKETINMELGIWKSGIMGFVTKRKRAVNFPVRKVLFNGTVQLKGSSHIKKGHSDSSRALLGRIFSENARRYKRGEIGTKVPMRIKSKQLTRELLARLSDAEVRQAIGNLSEDQIERFRRKTRKDKRKK